MLLKECSKETTSHGRMTVFTCLQSSHSRRAQLNSIIIKWCQCSQMLALHYPALIDSHHNQYSHMYTCTVVGFITTKPKSTSSIIGQSMQIAGHQMNKKTLTGEVKNCLESQMWNGWRLGYLEWLLGDSATSMVDLTLLNDLRMTW